MGQWLEEFPGQIELVICNNDEMALGAADALERAEEGRPIRIVGIDGTPQGLEGVKKGKLFGTVRCDIREYAEIIFEIAAAEALGQDVRGQIELTSGIYYECGQEAVTGEDLQ